MGMQVSVDLKYLNDGFVSRPLVTAGSYFLLGGMSRISSGSVRNAFIENLEFSKLGWLLSVSLFPKLFLKKNAITCQTVSFASLYKKFVQNVDHSP